jgi:hypothetical protein
MKKFFEIFFITLGVIFFLLILAGVYFWVADPFGLKPVIKMFTASSNQSSMIEGGKNIFPKTLNPDLNVATTSDSKKPILNSQQESALKAIGIDPAKLPSSITPAQEKCFIDALGTQRVNEIKAGAAPTPFDLFKAKGCL